MSCGKGAQSVWIKIPLQAVLRTMEKGQSGAKAGDSYLVEGCSVVLLICVHTSEELQLEGELVQLALRP